MNVSTFLESGEWKSLKPCGQSPGPRRRQGCVVIENRVFFFGGTSPQLLANQNNTPAVAQNENDIIDEMNLVDHDDMFVLDMGMLFTIHLRLTKCCLNSYLLVLFYDFAEPTLKTLCMLSVLKQRLETCCLPRILQQEITWMRVPNRISAISPLSSG